MELPPALPQAFFARHTLTVAQDLIGKILIKYEADGLMLQGRIVETEAYRGNDPASHAYRLYSQGRSPSGKAGFLYERPGLAYVYLNYGMYWLFNVVTEAQGEPGAVLIRALEPLSGITRMRERRPKARRDNELCNGPGKLALSMGINGQDHGRDLTTGPLYFCDDPATTATVLSSPRIGISQGQDLPWRFFMAHSPFVSPSPHNGTSMKLRS